MTIYFDMDGTIADLYSVTNWLPKLRAEDTSPYAQARPLVDCEKFSELVITLKNNGVKFGVISWTSKGGSSSYNKKVAIAKKKWLIENFPKIAFDEMHIIKYGTRKDYIAKDKGGFLFDDDEGVRKNWRGFAVNPETADIVEILTHLVELTD